MDGASKGRAAVNGINRNYQIHEQGNATHLELSVFEPDLARRLAREPRAIGLGNRFGRRMLGQRDNAVRRGELERSGVGCVVQCDDNIGVLVLRIRIHHD